MHRTSSPCPDRLLAGGLLAAALRNPHLPTGLRHPGHPRTAQRPALADHRQLLSGRFDLRHPRVRRPHHHRLRARTADGDGQHPGVAVRLHVRCRLRAGVRAFVAHQDEVVHQGLTPSVGLSLPRRRIGEERDDRPGDTATQDPEASPRRHHRIRLRWPRVGQTPQTRRCRHHPDLQDHQPPVPAAAVPGGDGHPFRR